MHELKGFKAAISSSKPQLILDYNLIGESTYLMADVIGDIFSKLGVGNECLTLKLIVDREWRVRQCIEYYNHMEESNFLVLTNK